ncbi:uncharacterized protein TNCV_2240511 [Trichonephila clavipes]|nr:uncharacterized protein TNCV_2240511 [Trichonephila clavipes]
MGKYELPCSISRKTRRIREDFKRTLKQKSSSLFVKKQGYEFTEKNRRYEAPGKFKYNRKDKKFPASTNYNKHYEVPVTKYESVQRYQDSAQKGYYNKNYGKHSNHNASKHAQTNYSKSQKFKEPSKETYTLIVKECLRSSPVPLKTRRVGQRCTLNLSRAETSSRWCGVVVRRGGARGRPRHLTMVQNYVVRHQSPRVAEQCDVNIQSIIPKQRNLVSFRSSGLNNFSAEAY